jgi:NADH:ubiquinone oxidoreductase subunit F (NADH-binding)
MTTICPLGPSATAPVVSILRHFRAEVEALIPGGGADG